MVLNGQSYLNWKYMESKYGLLNYSEINALSSECHSMKMDNFNEVLRSHGTTQSQFAGLRNQEGFFLTAGML